MISDFSTTPTGEVVIVAFVHAGHFSGFAANQRAASLQTAFADAGHNRRCGIHIEMAGGVVVEEKQRFGAANHDVVHAHSDQINTDMLVTVQLQRQAQLGAHAIGAGYQHGLLVAGWDFAERAETAEAAHHFGALGLLSDTLDTFDQMISGVDVYTGIFVTERRLGVCHG